MRNSPELVVKRRLIWEDVRTSRQKCFSRIQTFQTALEAICSWDTVLAISCVIGVSVDPFFFYLPIIQEETKCLRMDKFLRTAALLLRAITDLFLIVNIIYQYKLISARATPDRYYIYYTVLTLKRMFKLAQKWHSIMIDILAVLPIPQVLIGTLFQLGSFTYLGRRKTIDLLLLGQYLPRIYRMHHSSLKLRRTRGVWIRGAFYFFMYILASHVLGAFWYFFSIQREASCWHQTCLRHGLNECDFRCDQDMSSRNMTFVNSLDKFCLVDVPANATTPFDFGIFHDSLISGVTGKVNFGKKFLYSFWWGLRNLSNYGTNLETSTYGWENCFAILISIIGLLLFLYLIGNVQSFILMKNEIAEEKRKKLLSMKIDIQVWMDRNGIPKEMTNEVRGALEQNFEKMGETDMDGLFSILPVKTRIALKRFICMKILRKVPFPLRTTKSISDKEAVQEKVLTSICDFLKPVKYPDNSFVFRSGEPLDRMLLITQGLVWTYDTTESRATCLEKGTYYGDELVSWVSSGLNSLETVPMATANVKCHTKMEGFVLLAKDLKVIVHRHITCWSFSDPHRTKLEAIQTIQKAVRQFRHRGREVSKVLDDAPQDDQEAVVVVEVQPEDTTYNNYQSSNSLHN